MFTNAVSLSQNQKLNNRNLYFPQLFRVNEAILGLILGLSKRGNHGLAFGAAPAIQKAMVF